MLHAVIMAGGSGTRFWPVSRNDRPKQFLSLADEKPLLRATFERLEGLVPPERTWVITSAAAAPLTRQLLPEVPAANVLGEPEGRDTAACVGYAACVTRHHDPDAVCVVLPADHVIDGTDRFRAAMAAGAQHVAAQGGLLTFGVRPTRPETGYGYLKLGERCDAVAGFAVHRLDRFVEKPNHDDAERYLANDVYLWNSGMFAWRADAILDEIGRQLPRLAAGLERLAASLGTADEEAVVNQVYPTLQRVSIDFGVMEGAEQCWTVPVDFSWSDVGSWPTLAELLHTDARDNACRGRILALDASRNILVSHGPMVAAIGVSDLVVVATADAVLVVPVEQAQRVKQAVKKLEERGWNDLL